MRTPSSRSLRFAVASTALIGLSVVTIANLSSSALLTSSATAGPASLTAGRITLGLTQTVSTDLASSPMLPGDTPKYTKLTVANAGSVIERYSVSLLWSANNALSQGLQVSVQKLATGSTACDGTLAWGTGDLATNVSLASGTAISGTTYPTALVGATAAGNQTGDRYLVGSATGQTSYTFNSTTYTAATEYLCVREQLPSAYTDNTGATADVSLLFSGEQVANNA